MTLISNDKVIDKLRSYSSVFSRSSFIKLKDAKGRSRIEISVQADGNPKINFLYENGKVLYGLPEEKKPGKQ